ncbi:MAG: hypothetical protein EOP06_26740, partial [Proteobacteria bacterium]
MEIETIGGKDTHYTDSCNFLNSPQDPLQLFVLEFSFARTGRFDMARAVWSGAISFGLVNIPVSALGAREQKKISFHMLDSEDNGAIGYKKINKGTGKEVPAKRIVKGYEYKKGEFVIITDADFKKANPVATQTIDIEDFVEVEDIDILMFEKPYYLVPTKAGRKGYVL